ncbi:helix-turn-helix domain-containing protein [Mucilaginibacter sabulilitoris]|uniref:Helix-turn-helix domain-containing protein n=1 Tax=Mucilaginibacter sabulilitoris TaxID=1173583 RepID=A0ABZ0TTP7_9SPHI|nr:helix-turn-helix domain-containing protein [Mucilaginibacter sabulilitoris]WPU96141.1 helix-turn-helix domain-containing protein [Mucilaginibacter sabulilitoris]
MEHKNVQELARLVRQHRLQKKFTQQELAECTGISLRSIQRIENAEVWPRTYTLKTLATQLGFELDQKEPIKHIAARKLNQHQKLVLTFGLAFLLILLACAFVFQSPTFPETQFELSLYVAGVIVVYTIFMLIIWR